MSREIYLVRSEVLLGFDDLVQELGADPVHFYRRAGLSAELMDNPDYMVPVTSICALLNIAAKELGRDDIGLMLGYRRKVFQIGLLWPLVAHCPSVGQALEAIMKHLHLHNRGTLWQVDTEGDSAFLTRADRVSSEVSTFQWAVYSTCAMLSGMKVLCGKDWQPSSVSFINPSPVDSQPYDQFFGVKVAFGREFNRIVFPASDLRREILHHNKNLYSQLSKQIQALEDEYERQEGFCAKVKLLIEQRIHTIDCTQTAIAAVLSMHPKALQRELKCHGVTFRELKAEVRLDIAEHYLKDSAIPLTTIAYILGFSELSSFSHAFKNRHHVSPAVWREKVKH
ncbi:AraC family transcriptional regulator [Marinobacterium maritimum]|uniref:AraC family transcriptional regulator n=1 Tax=Marinobacterium maritimum TaxID=500162 RepID=A0ABN1I5W0_9GAMM